MSTPEDFERRLSERMGQAGGALAGHGVTFDGVTARHRERMRARRARQGAVAAVAAGVLAVTGIGIGMAADGDAPAQVVAGPTAGDPGAGATEVCDDGAAVIVYVRPKASEAEVRAVGQVLEGRFGEPALRFVSQEEAYQEARDLFADQPTTRDLLRPEDVPASYRIGAGPDADLLSLRDEVQELLTGTETMATEAVVGEAVVAGTTPAPAAGAPAPSTTTTRASDDLALTEEQYQAILVYIRTLQIGPILPAGSCAETPSTPPPSLVPEEPVVPAGSVDLVDPVVPAGSVDLVDPLDPAAPDPTGATGSNGSAETSEPAETVEIDTTVPGPDAVIPVP